MLEAITSMLARGVPSQPPSDDEIRERAYHLWEEAGRPDGDGVDFWVRAEEELASAR